MISSCHAENSVVVLRFRKTFVDAWRELFLDDILTDVAASFGGVDHDDVVAGAAADGHLEGIERQGRHTVLLAGLGLRDDDLRHTFRPGEGKMKSAIQKVAFGYVSHLELSIWSYTFSIF